MRGTLEIGFSRASPDLRSVQSPQAAFATCLSMPSSRAKTTLSLVVPSRVRPHLSTLALSSVPRAWDWGVRVDYPMLQEHEDLGRAFIRYSLVPLIRAARDPHRGERAPGPMPCLPHEEARHARLVQVPRGGHALSLGLAKRLRARVHGGGPSRVGSWSAGYARAVAARAECQRCCRMRVHAAARPFEALVDGQLARRRHLERRASRLGRPSPR